MAKKKRTSRKPTTRKKKTAPKRKPAARKAPRRTKKATARKTARRKPASRKAATKKKPAVRKATRPKAKRASGARQPRGRAASDLDLMPTRRGLGAETGGQSGDTEGLSREELADSESVEELLEEGQAFEAGIVDGVENAPNADRGGVRTRQVPEDDVPQEYIDED
jgi:hypothetical protein